MRKGKRGTGTRITRLEEVRGDDASMVKGFATIDGVALINVEGTGMVGVPGTASTIFSTVRDANVNVIMISQVRTLPSLSLRE